MDRDNHEIDSNIISWPDSLPLNQSIHCINKSNDKSEELYFPLTLQRKSSKEQVEVLNILC